MLIHKPAVKKYVKEKNNSLRVSKDFFNELDRKTKEKIDHAIGKCKYKTLRMDDLF